MDEIEISEFENREKPKLKLNKITIQNCNLKLRRKIRMKLDFNPRLHLN